MHRQVGAFLVALLLSAACQGSPSTHRPSDQPSAKRILELPYRSTMQDGHFTELERMEAGAASSAAVGHGFMTLRPKSALRLVKVGVVLDQRVRTEYVSIAGMNYQRVNDQPVWNWEPGSRISDPTTWVEATNVQLLGQEKLPLGQAWHVSAVAPGFHDFEVWVRVVDGYLLRFHGRNDGLSFDMTFDSFNVGASIDPPGPVTARPQAPG